MINVVKDEIADDFGNLKLAKSKPRGINDKKR